MNPTTKHTHGRTLSNLNGFDFTSMKSNIILYVWNNRIMLGFCWRLHETVDYWTFLTVETIWRRTTLENHFYHIFSVFVINKWGQTSHSKIIFVNGEHKIDATRSDVIKIANTMYEWNLFINFEQMLTS